MDIICSGVGVGDVGIMAPICNAGELIFKQSIINFSVIHITSCQRGPGPKPPPAASPTSTTALGLTTASLAGNITSTGGGITTAKAPAPQSGGSIPSFGGGSGSPPGGGGGSGGGGKGRKGPPPDYSTELETELRETLFSGYSRNQRPQKRVIVKVSLNLMSINYLVSNSLPKDNIFPLRY